jgi:hypothetical protein
MKTLSPWFLFFLLLQAQDVAGTWEELQKYYFWNEYKFK